MSQAQIARLDHLEEQGRLVEVHTALPELCEFTVRTVSGDEVTYTMGADGRLL